MRRLYCAVVLAASLGILLAGAAWAANASVVSQGDPFASCIGVGADVFGGINYPDTEVEPWVAADPTHSRNFVGTWQQDRWSDGGAKGLVAGWSSDGGKTWGETPLPFSLCAAPFYHGAVLPYERASDPWNSIGPDGKSYAVSISFNGNDNNNAVGAATSTDGGRTWQNLRAVITDLDSDPTFPFNDKESVTADPLLAGYAYVVWDRLQSVECPPGVTPRRPAEEERPSRQGEVSTSQLNCFIGPTYFSRTTDGGQTWSTPTAILETPANEQTIGNVIVVDRQTGILYDFFTYIDAAGNFTVAVIHTSGPGTAPTLTWSQPFVISHQQVVGAFDPRNGDELRTGAIIPEPAIDPRSGRQYVVWEDSRFNNDQNDQVVISTSPRGGTSWTAPALVSPDGDPAAFTPSIAVNTHGQVGVTYYDFGDLSNVSTDVLPTNYWFTQTDASLQFEPRTQIFGPFNFKAAPEAGGFFLGDYEGLVPAGEQGFLPLFGATNCNDTICTAIGNPTGAPTGGPDPTDIYATKAGG